METSSFPKPLTDHPLAGEWNLMRAIVPRAYACARARGPITVDGKLDDPAWTDAPWTADFVDIEGARKPAPRFRTRAKMLWDDEFLYVAAELEEPHVCATLTERNAVIYNDNDFEIFIDPDGDNHDYYEFEINALGTIWELTLPRPYKDGGQPRLGTNLPGLRPAVHVRGTINDPSDVDSGWTVEIALPWRELASYNAGRPTPPRDGDLWRINFSRVQWTYDIRDGRYARRPKETNPEDNWVWSPQGIIDLHRPERWGFVQFIAGNVTNANPTLDPTLRDRELLMEVYHRQRGFRERNGRWARSLSELQLDDDLASMSSDDQTFRATRQVRCADGRVRALRVRHDSKLWFDD